MEWPSSLSLAVWLTMHLGALGVAFLSRLPLGARTDKALQLLTATGFFAIASLAVLSMLAGGDQFRLWVISGGVLGAMVIAAVVAPVGNSHDPVLARFAAAED